MLVDSIPWSQCGLTEIRACCFEEHGRGQSIPDSACFQGICGSAATGTSQSMLPNRMDIDHCPPAANACFGIARPVPGLYTRIPLYLPTSFPYYTTELPLAAVP